MLNQPGWILLKNPITFEIEKNTTKFSLAQLPPQARKVKLFVYQNSGVSGKSEQVTWSLFTKIDIIKVQGHPYGYGAMNTTSDNCTLILDDRKIIEISRSGNFPGSYFSLNVEILAYK